MDNFIKYFFENSEKEFHVRELAKLSDKSPTTVAKYLNNLKKEGILKSERKFNHLFFKANSEDVKFKELKFGYNLKKLRASGLIEFLDKEYNHPGAIVLFGSFRKAENFSESDIDLLVVTPLKKKLDFTKFERKLGHKIQLFQHSITYLDKMKVKNKELLNNFINGYIVQGYLELFWWVLKIL